MMYHFVYAQAVLTMLGVPCPSEDDGAGNIDHLRVGEGGGERVFELLLGICSKKVSERNRQGAW